jgi:hypothetical protein
VDVLTRVSSESDPAALAPLQQGFYVLSGQVVHSLSRIATIGPVRESLREGSQGVWQARVVRFTAAVPARTVSAAGYRLPS